MVEVKDTSIAKANYEGSASEATRRWKAAIPKASWKEAAVSSEAVELHRTRTMEALDAGRRERGLEGWNDAKWRSRTVTKGGPSIERAMKASGDKWKEGFDPYAQELRNVDLPPKTADWESNIDNRAKPIVRALVEKKKEIKG